MSLIAVGTNHKYSPITLRERISFSQKRLKDALNFLRERKILKGAVLLSTCNRVEIYASAEEAKSAIKEIEDFICRYHEINRERLLPYLYLYTDKQALRHLLSVACGLDSLILGETQILGQVKHALAQGLGADFVDSFLQRIFDSALALARKVQAETKISQGKVSVGSVAIDFIKERLGSLRRNKILIIGAGKVSELLSAYLKEENADVLFVANRSFSKAEGLASQIGARAVRFDELKQYLRQTDVVICATSSPHYIIKKEMLEQIVNNEQYLYTLTGTSGHRRTTNNELLIIDLALPRDVEPDVKELKGVELFCLEDLTVVIKENKQRKSQEAAKVEATIDKECEKIWEEITELAQEPALSP